ALKPVKPGAAIRGFLRALAVPASRIPNTLEEQAGLYRSLLAGKRVLVVLDDARNEDQVRPLLPGSSLCMVIVTSRSQLTGLAAGEGAHVLSLGVLTACAAREFLASRLGQEPIAAEPHAAAELVGLCAQLPLALSVVAARAAVLPKAPLATLAAELRDTQTRLDALNTGDVSSDVRAAFYRSYQDLSGPAAWMFRLLGLHPGLGPALPHVCSASLPSTLHPTPPPRPLPLWLAFPAAWPQWPCGNWPGSTWPPSTHPAGSPSTTCYALMLPSRPVPSTARENAGQRS